MQKLNWTPKTKLEKAGLKATNLLTQAGFQSFWVGGVVRNLLLKLPSQDIDMATDATPDAVERVFKKAKYKTVPVGKEFGSILVIVDGEKIEITTFRKEGKYNDARHPDLVDFVQDYIQDASRRDFTINAFYFDPISKFLYDPTNGMKDLKGKLIRFIGDARDRIDEDYLRMLRAVRLSVQIGFRIEDRSYAAIKHRVKHIQRISGERVKAELDKMMVSPKAGEGIRLLEKIGLLKHISPELDEVKHVFHNSKMYHLEGDTLTHSIMVMEAIQSDDLDLKYAALFHDAGKVSTGKKVFKNGEEVFSFRGHVDISGKIFSEFAKRYKFSRQATQKILWLIALHDSKKEFMAMDNAGKVEQASNPYFPLLLDIWQADLEGNITTAANESNKKAKYLGYIQGKKMAVRINRMKKVLDRLADGKIIMKEKNIPAGKNIGKILRDVRAEIVFGKIKNISDLKKYLKTQK